MKAKKIVNIVFYKVFDGSREYKKACIFYHDGSVLDTSFEEGLDACEEIVKERNITSKNAFQEMINKDIVHVMSAQEFSRNFKKFIGHEILRKEEIEESVEEEMRKAETKEFTPTEEDVKRTTYITSPIEEQVERSTSDPEEVVEEKPDLHTIDEEIVDGEDISDINEEKLEEKKEEVVDSGSDEIVEEPQEEVQEETKKEEKPKKEGFFKRMWRKFKESRLGVKLTAIGLALLIGLGIYGCAKRQTLDGAMYNSNLTAQDTTLNNNDNNDQLNVVNRNNGNANTGAIPADVEQFYDPTTDSMLVKANNDYYDDYSYEQLLAVTSNETQKTAMTNAHNTLYGFNGTFADAYVEEGKDIRAALTFDEVIALQQAYNDYSKDQIRAIFNGAEVNGSKMSENYKSATLQLMGAHVIENSEHPVDMSMLLETEEGKEFYARYHELFLKAKETTGEEQLQYVKAFYDAVKEDFPITEEVRTEGIAHADRFADLDSYKLSVVPMIAASEMLFQNLEVDYTLNDTEINFLNDMGLCNVAYDKFDRIEAITLSTAEEDNTNPLYEQYRNEMIASLIADDIYGIKDEQRELTKLDRFQEVLEQFSMTSTEYYEYTYTTPPTYHEETTITEGEIPESERQRIDDELEKENEEARRRGEEEAEKERQRLQEEADKQAQEVLDEIEEDHQDMQDRIDDANDQIDKNHDDDPSNDKPVNEEDFGDHNVDFYDDYEDGNGNLDDSVENITTDPEGDQTGEPLPDPNETGEEFDAAMDGYGIPTEFIDEGDGEIIIDYGDGGNAQGNTKNSAPASTPEVQARVAEPVEAYVEEEPVYTPVEIPATEYVSEDAYIEYNVPSNEEIVEEYLNSLEGQDSEEDSLGISK